MARDSLHMCKTWTAAPPPPAAPGVHVRPLRSSDEAMLGELTWLVFHDSSDSDWYPSRDDAAADAGRALAGHWGPVAWDASLAAELGPALASATIVVRHDKHGGVPLLAFAMTHPACQGRGIGRALIAGSVHRLDGTGAKELHLAVTRGNRAVALYERLGFAVVP